MRAFFLRVPATAVVSDKDEATLYVRVQSKGLNLLISSGVKVNVSKWRGTSLSPTKRLNYLSEKNDSADLNETTILERLQMVDGIIDTLINDGVTDTATIKKAITAVLHKDSKDRLDKVRQESERSQRDKEDAENRNVLLCCKKYIAGIKDGSIPLQRGNGQTSIYTEGTCKAWGCFYGALSRFYNKESFTWDDINKSFYLKWCSYLKRYGYMDETISKYNSCFKHLVNYYLGEGVHNNAAAFKLIRKQTEFKAKDKAAEIYLTKEELQALYEMKLYGLKEQVRDLFLIGTYTCQRFSDYSRITKESFRVSDKGNATIVFSQQKTGSEAIVPIMDDNLVSLFEKYNYSVPKVNDVIMNRYIKEVCSELSVRVKSLQKLVITKLTMKEIKKEAEYRKEKGEDLYKRDSLGNVLKPRYECVSSHTARRSGITLMVMKDIYSIEQMMTVSGHQTAKEFEKYNKMSGNEQIDKMIEASKNKSLF